MTDRSRTMANLHGTRRLPSFVHGVREVHLMATLRVFVVIEVYVRTLEVTLLPALERFGQLQLSSCDEEVAPLAVELEPVASYRALVSDMRPKAVVVDDVELVAFGLIKVSVRNGRIEDIRLNVLDGDRTGEFRAERPLEDIEVVRPPIGD